MLDDFVSEEDILDKILDNIDEANRTLIVQMPSWYF
jgi:hypothetical protein